LLNRVLVPAFLLFHVAGTSVSSAEHASSIAQAFHFAGTHQSDVKPDSPRSRQKRIAETPTVIPPVTVDVRPIPVQIAAISPSAEQLASGANAPTLSRGPPAVL
jgi:hypothetical protein